MTLLCSSVLCPERQEKGSERAGRGPRTAWQYGQNQVGKGCQARKSGALWPNKALPEPHSAALPTPREVELVGKHHRETDFNLVPEETSPTQCCPNVEAGVRKLIHKR